MADFQHSTPASCANPDPFDPRDWLARFKEAGGWWVVGADNKLGFGIPEEASALAIFGEVDGDQAKRAAVKAHLLNLTGEAVHGQA